MKTSNNEKVLDLTHFPKSGQVTKNFPLYANLDTLYGNLQK